MRRTSSFLIIPLLIATLLPAVAADANNQLVVEAGNLEAKLSEIEAEIEDLKSSLVGTEGEDELVLTRQLSEARMKGLAEVGALCDNVLAQEEEGLDATVYRTLAVSWLEQITPTFQRLLAEQEAEIAATREEREGIEPHERIEFEELTNGSRLRLDALYDSYLEHVGRLEAMGLRVGDARAQLSTRVSERAKDLSGRLSVVRDNVESLRDRATTDAENMELQAELRAGELRLEGNSASLATAVNVMQGLDLETAEYQKQLIEVTGEISSGVLDSAVALGLLQQWGAKIKGWVVESGPDLFFKVLLFVLILLASRLLAGIVRKVVKRSVASSRFSLSRLLQEMIVKMSGGVVLVAGLLVALSQIGLSLGPMLAGLGIAGFILGFALQDSLSNFASGVMILIYQPYDVGDLIEATGVFGKVSHMSLVSTTVLTLDHQTLIVPNSKIWGDVIKNVTAQKVRRIDMIFGVSYGDDIPKVEEVLREILAEHPKVVEDPAPVVHLHTLGESSVDFVVRPWVATDDYWEVYWDVTREVKMRFDREGIAIPFPQRDIHLYEEKVEVKRARGAPAASENGAGLAAGRRGD